MPDFAERRARMVREQIERRGVRDPGVLAAMAAVPRERFLPEDLAEQAYEDRPLPIGAGQTISQPLVVALMAEAAELRPGDRVLEIGTGSGYGAAVLRHIAAEVVTVERHAALAGAARRNLLATGMRDVTVAVGDGSLGWPPRAPYDAIVVTAAGPVLPAALREQLAPRGRLVMPVGTTRFAQSLRRLRRTATGFVEDDLGDVAFVPLVGAQGWPGDPS